MKVSELLESRRVNWHALEQMCEVMERSWGTRLDAPAAVRFATLYRAACADLALADAYQLPPGTTQYLHRLVGRAHNLFYRSQPLDWRPWAWALLTEAPQRLYRDRALRLAFVLFWGTFLLSAMLAYSTPDFARRIMGEDMIQQLEEMYSEPIGQGRGGVSPGMVGFYIWNNTGIGLRCFASGLIFGVGGLFVTLFNAAVLGAAFGHMATVPQRANFFHFVTAHSVLELTAIVVAAGAGMRLGFALVDTHGLRRVDSLRQAASESLPTLGAFVILFFLAALVEGLLSPSNAPYGVKAGAAVISAVLMLVYVVGLGARQGVHRATG